MNVSEGRGSSRTSTSVPRVTHLCYLQPNLGADRLLAAINFTGINGVVIATSWLLVRHRIHGRLDQLLAIFTLSVAQIVLTMLMAGTVFGLTPKVLWTLNLGLLILAAATRARPKPSAKPGPPPPGPEGAAILACSHPDPVSKLDSSYLAPSRRQPLKAPIGEPSGPAEPTIRAGAGPAKARSIPSEAADRARLWGLSSRTTPAPPEASSSGESSGRGNTWVGTGAALFQGFTLPAWLRGNLWVQIFLALTLGELAWLILLGYLFPEMAWDSLYYHLPAVVTWLKEQRLVLTPYNIWTNVYPMNTELLMAWILLFTGSEAIIDLVQLPFAVAGSLATYGLGRQIGLAPANSAVAGCMFFLTPIVLVQSKTCYVDVAFAGLFLVAFYFAFSYFLSPRRGHSLLAGISSGIVLGMKASASAYVAVILFLVLAGSLKAARQAQKGVWAYWLRDLTFFALAFLVAGSFWYFRNWVSYGNPLYPFTIKLLGITIWPGQGSIDELIMQANTPPQLQGLPSWKQLLLSWLESPAPYNFDQRIGGLGPQWLWLEFPATLLVLGLAALRRDLRLLWLLLPLALLFVVQPSNWWSRYTLFVVAAGAVSVAYLEQSLPRSHAPLLRIYTLALVLVSLSLSFTQSYYPLSEVRRFLTLPQPQRTFFQLGYHLKPWGREAAWVESIPPGSKIAMTEARFPYLLFGPKLDNQVLVLMAGSDEEMLKCLRDSGAQFFFTSEASEYNLWAQKWPQVLIPLYAASDYVAYRVDQGRLAALPLR